MVSAIASVKYNCVCIYIVLLLSVKDNLHHIPSFDKILYNKYFPLSLSFTETPWITRDRNKLLLALLHLQLHRLQYLRKTIVSLLKTLLPELSQFRQRMQRMHRQRINLNQQQLLNPTINRSHNSLRMRKQQTLNPNQLIQVKHKQYLLWKTPRNSSHQTRQQFLRQTKQLLHNQIIQVNNNHHQPQVQQQLHWTPIKRMPRMYPMRRQSQLRRTPVHRIYRLLPRTQ